MTLESTFGFALVLLAVASVGLAWIIFALRRESTLICSSAYNTRRLCAALQQRLVNAEKNSSTSLAVEVASLSDAVSRLRQTHQRFQGRFDMHAAKENALHEAHGGGS